VTDTPEQCTQALTRLLETLKADMAFHEAGAKQSKVTEGCIAHSGMAAGLHIAIIRSQQSMGGDPRYVSDLASQLQQRHPDLLATAEDDLALLRGRLAIVATFIHNTDHDHAARQALAHALGLPEPRQETP